MKITVEFDEKEEALDALHVYDFKCSLEEIDNYCRGLLKHGDINDETEKHLEHIRELVFRMPNG